MSAVVNPAAMFEPMDAGKLIEEIDRYLAAVDLFRAEACEPTWRPELHAEVAMAAASVGPQRLPSDITLH